MIYAVWRACERFGIMPPNIKNRWEDNLPEAQSELIAYSQLRETEEVK